MTLVEAVISDGKRVMSYTELQNRLTALGMEIEEGKSPEEAYKQAELHFKRSQSPSPEATLVPVGEKAK